MSWWIWALIIWLVLGFVVASVPALIKRPRRKGKSGWWPLAVVFILIIAVVILGSGLSIT